MNHKVFESRKACGMTQKQVADIAGISERMYQHIEAGTRTGSISTLLKIGMALGKTVEDLFSE